MAELEATLVFLAIFFAGVIGMAVARRAPVVGMLLGIAITAGTTIFAARTIYLFLHMGLAGWLLSMIVFIPAFLIAALGVKIFRTGSNALEGSHGEAGRDERNGT
jgi:hypothetical protein